MPSIERFNKRWASSGQTETITDNNAELGLAFIGDDPPTIELHNKMFQMLDDKDNLLFNWINEVVKERTGGAGLTTELNTQLRDAIATAASYTKTGLQRNGTAAEVAALLSGTLTVTPATLKPLLDALNLAISRAVPTAAVMAFSRNTAPDGWLVADGSSVSRTAYANLFSVIGTMYGAQDSNSFNLPNMQHKIVRGWPGESAGPDAGRALGSTQQPSNNAHTHVLTISAIGAHTHTFNTQAAGGHTHGMTMGGAGAHNHTISVAAAGAHAHNIGIAANGSHSHGGFTNEFGAHSHNIVENMDRAPGTPGNAVFGDEAYYGQSTRQTDVQGNHAHGLYIVADGYHAHSASADVQGNHAHTASATAVGDHTHILGMDIGGNHAHTGTTDAAGAFAPTGTAASEGSETRMLNISLLYCIKT